MNRANPEFIKCMENIKSKERLSQYDLRDLVMLEAATTYGGYGLAYSGGTFRMYAGGVWHDITEWSVTQMVGKHIEEAAEARQVTPSATLETNVTRAIKSKVYVPEDKWDADPDLLVFQDRALRVSTGDVLKHDPKHYVTNAFPYNYPNGERSELWEMVVGKLLGEAEASFFQEYCGYCLTTSVRHQIMLWLVGMPGGGKSTLILGVREMLGPRCGTLGLSHLQGSGARFALSNLPGKTLMTCTENPSGYLKTTEILNSLVTGDPIRVERKNRDAFDYAPTAKLLWAMNSLPGLQDPTNGLFRRAKILEMDALSEGERDPDIIERIPREAPGILTWALEGLQRLNKRGHFEFPPSVSDASARFRKDNDLAAQFIEDRCERGEGPDYQLYATPLTNAYNEWALDNGHAKKSSKSLAQDWRRLGLDNGKRDSHGQLWRGIQTKATKHLQ